MVIIPTTPTYALGVESELLEDCANVGMSCVSSQDDTPSSFLEPWEYDEIEELPVIKRRLTEIILIQFQGSLIKEDDQYLRFRIGNDDIEFYFPQQDNLVHFRSSPQNGTFDWWRNRRRLESLRISLGLENITVLRNRTSPLSLFQTPFDEFGPSAVDTDKIIENNGITSRQFR